jgi:hypothetical protein
MPRDFVQEAPPAASIQSNVVVINPTADTAVRDDSPPPAQPQSSGNTIVQHAGPSVETKEMSAAAAEVGAHSSPDVTPQPSGNKLMTYLLLLHDFNDFLESLFSHQSDHSVDDMDISVELEQSPAITVALPGIFYYSFPLIKY